MSLPTTNGSPPAAIIFDMDGLMLDTEKIYQRAWQRAASELGYSIEPALFHRLVGMRTEDCEALIVATLGMEFPLERFQSHWMAQWHQEVENHGIELKPGLIALLDWIDAQGIAKAVATSSTRVEATRCLGLSGLDKRFSIVVTGDDVEWGKPAPDIFDEAARRLGVAAHSCWVFEDSSAGTIGASKAGMDVVIVPDLHAPTAEAAALATAIIPSLTDALPLLCVAVGEP